MSDLASVPKPHVENIGAIADFAELECLRRADGNVSAVDITRIMVRETEASSEEAVRQRVEEAFEELAARSRDCGSDDGRYPYEVAEGGTLVQVRPATEDVKDAVTPAMVYFYLLLATRMNMKTQRSQGGEDATVLFEHLCREAAVRFWGGPSASVSALVFGTGRQTEDLQDYEDLDAGRFRGAVDQLCQQLREGVGFHSVTQSRITARDGKLDVVVWRGFADGRQGQLIGFGQCKTGKHWDRDLMKLRPEGFCAKWMRQRPAVLPVRLYFVADRVVERWYDNCIDGGIVFDRCRILEHCSDLPAPLVARIANWVRAAAASEGLAIP